MEEAESKDQPTSGRCMIRVSAPPVDPSRDFTSTRTCTDPLKATTPAPDGGETERYSSIIATLVCELTFSFVNGLLT